MSIDIHRSQSYLHLYLYCTSTSVRALFYSVALYFSMWLINSRAVIYGQVNKRCKLYCQQIQSVVSSFEAVAGVANSAPFICHAIRAISVNFGCLKNVILSRFGETSRALWGTIKNDDHIHDPTTLNYLSSALRTSNRGLPEHAVAVLKKWLFEHFLHP